jgi:hypothetical protein
VIDNIIISITSITNTNSIVRIEVGSCRWVLRAFGNKKNTFVVSSYDNGGSTM